MNDKEKFAVELCVEGFKPEELSVNLKETELSIEGKHDERDEQGARVQRHFVRKYILPDNVDLDAVVSQLTPEGVLSVTAPKLASPKLKNIPISQVEKK